MMRKAGSLWAATGSAALIAVCASAADAGAPDVHSNVLEEVPAIYGMTLGVKF